MSIIGDHLRDNDFDVPGARTKLEQEKSKKSLLEKLKAVGAGSVKAETISESSFFKVKDIIQTNVPIINTAFTGTLDGGVVSGLSVFAGESKTFKSCLGLMCVRSYLKKYPDGICLFYDTEFGITPEYLIAHGIDTTRVLHIPVEHIEELKFDIVKRLDEIKKSDKVIIFIDSIGNIASKKEVEDAEAEKGVSDMTRAKSLKGLFRIITPHLNMKDIPCLVINHTYSEQGMYPKEIMSGGRGLYYSANNIFFITRSQEKDGTELIGFNFTINVEKSRFVIEKSKLKFLVKFDGGIDKWSGLLDIALESGHVVKPSNGWYAKLGEKNKKGEEVKYREADTHNKEFWTSIMTDKTFYDFVKNKYQLSIAPISIEED